MASIREYPPKPEAFLCILTPTFPSCPTPSLSLSLSLSLSTFSGVAEAMSDEASATPPTPSLWSTMNSWFTPPVLFLLLNLMIATIAITSQLGSSPGSTHDEHRKDHQEHETPKNPPAPPFARPPSTFQRLKSIIFFWNRPQEQPTWWPTPVKAPEMEIHQPFQETEHEQRQEKGPEQEQENPSRFARSPSMPQKPRPSGLYSHIVIEPTATPAPTPTGNVDYPNLEPVAHYSSRPKQAEAQEHEEEEEEDDVGADEAESGVAINGFPRTMRRSASAKYPTVHIDEDDDGEEDGDFLEMRRPASAREGNDKTSGHGDEEVDARADDFINRFKHQLKLQRIDSITRRNRGDHN